MPHIYRGPELVSPHGNSLVSLALASAERTPDRTALIDAPSGNAISYGELAERFLRAATSLRDSGFQDGEVAGTLAPNSTEWVIFALAVMAAGGIVSGINPALRPDEVARQIRASGATSLAVAPELTGVVAAAGIGDALRRTFVLGGAQDQGRSTLENLIRDGAPGGMVPVPGELALLPFSSGTSGFPKGVEVGHRSLVLDAASATATLEMMETDVLMAASPLFHIAGVSGMLAPALALGLPVVILSVADFDSLLAAIARYRVTLSVLTPPAIRAFARHPVVDRHDLSSLRALACTAAPLAAEIETAAARRLGTVVFQAYGMTESVGAITLGPISDPRPGSVGKSTPGFEICIADPVSGGDLDTGAVGEIRFRSAMSMRGYRNDPTATAEVVAEDGWMRSGDAGYVDADGYLHIVDRLKEFIKVDAAQVAPAELEAVIMGFPGVEDVGVVGCPSPETGERPVAFVVAAEPIRAEALMAWTAERVAPFKRLLAVEFVDAVPRQPNGKIMRRLLREHAAG
jgi:acyl-CoA synthetase (AMP-forming)/AMP-acid ligase II